MVLEKALSAPYFHRTEMAPIDEKAIILDSIKGEFATHTPGLQDKVNYYNLRATQLQNLGSYVAALNYLDSLYTILLGHITDQPVQTYYVSMWFSRVESYIYLHQY